MLLDPLVVNTGATSYTLVGATASNYARLGEGKFIGANIGTTDEPHFVDVTNRMNFDGSSVFTVKSRQAKNVPAINGIPQKDDVIEVSIQVKYAHRSFVLANIVDHVLRVANITCGYGDKLSRGEK